MWNRWHFIGQLAYSFEPEDENGLVVSAASIFEINERFGFVGELSVSDFDEDNPVDLSGGMYYDWGDSLRMDIHGGTELDSQEDVYGMLRFAYNFFVQ